MSSAWDPLHGCDDMTGGFATKGFQCNGGTLQRSQCLSNCGLLTLLLVYSNMFRLTTSKGDGLMLCRRLAL